MLTMATVRIKALTKSGAIDLKPYPFSFLTHQDAEPVIPRLGTVMIDIEFTALFRQQHARAMARDLRKR